MSWHLKTCGTKSEVFAAIDEAVAASNGMPRAVGDYLNNAIDAIDLTDGAADGTERCLVMVESSGHRPMYASGEEKCLVTKLRRGPLSRPATASDR